MAFSKIVIKNKKGEILKGTTGDFSPRSESFHFTPLIKQECSATIKVIVNNLKAIFFVKDFAGDKYRESAKKISAQPRPGEKLIEVRFLDGEQMTGIAHGFHLDRLGFFITPLDQDSNNERIFVILSSLDSLNVNNEEIPVGGEHKKETNRSCPTCQVQIKADWHWCPFDGTPLDFI
ncbi:MAG: hypothetical protein KKB30_15560 [Proteobacteria bacterium]|nr:hypothetical protein [Pseudomonadota bacterium]MBU1714439.1 hypothetical protein [Pseudomonadota bacterium]